MSVEPIDAGGILRVGGVLMRAWRLFAGDILLFLAVPLLIYAIDLVATEYLTGLLARLADAMPGLPANAQAGWMLAVIGFLGVLLTFGLNMLGQAVLVLGAVQRLGGRRLRIGEVLQNALARVFPLLGLVLFWSLALGLCLVLSALLLSFALWGFAGGELVGLLPYFQLVVLLPLLFLASLVPTAILLVVTMVVVPACMVARLGPRASMARSIALTKGNRWKVFAIMLLLAMVILGGKFIEQLVAPEEWAFDFVVDGVWFVPLMGYWNAIVIMTYYGLRVAKEGVDAGQIAAIFE
jgi:hypothetical protein